MITRLLHAVTVQSMPLVVTMTMASLLFADANQAIPLILSIKYAIRVVTVFNTTIIPKTNVLAVLALQPVVVWTILDSLSFVVAQMVNLLIIITEFVIRHVRMGSIMILFQLNAITVMLE